VLDVMSVVLVWCVVEMHSYLDCCIAKADIAEGALMCCTAFSVLIGGVPLTFLTVCPLSPFS
jgi:hypothetical protein